MKRKLKKIINLILITSLLILNAQLIYADEISGEEGLDIVKVDVESGEKTYMTIPINDAPTDGWGPQRPESPEPFSIVGSDEIMRVERGDEMYMPFSAIGAFRMYQNSTLYHGTAFMVGPNVALTAAHCVFDNGSSYDNMTFAPGQNGSSAPFGTAAVTEYYYPQEWEDTHNSKYDWAVIKLSTNVGNSCGWFGISDYATLSNPGNFLLISGYPGEYRHGTYAEQWFSEETFIRYDANEFWYEIDTTAGQSGSPLLVFTNSTYRAVGIHTNGYDTGLQQNHGKRINAEIISMVNQFRS